MTLYTWVAMLTFDDLFVLYLQDNADSLYASFTRELTRRWDLESGG
jgi:hypothetical protein